MKLHKFIDLNLEDSLTRVDCKINSIVTVRAILACSVLVLLASCGTSSQEEVAGKIAASEQLRNIDRICSEFPKPPSFHQLKKGVSEDSETSSIYYQYSSDQPFGPVRSFYQDSANLGEYVLVSENYTDPEDSLSTLRFRRDDIGITLGHRPPETIFTLDCIK